MKAGPLLEKAIDILAYDSGGRPNPDYQFPKICRLAIELTESALAKLVDKSLSDILPTEDLIYGDDEAFGTFVCGEDVLQKAIITKYLGGPGRVAFGLLTRIFDGNLSDAIIYPPFDNDLLDAASMAISQASIIHTTQSSVQW